MPSTQARQQQPDQPQTARRWRNERPSQEASLLEPGAGGDPLVHEAPFQHMTEPASHQPIIQARNAEHPRSRHRPDIRYECRSHSDENDMQNKHLPFLSTCVDH